MPENSPEQTTPEPTPALPAFQSSGERLFRLIRKELQETLRDRRTLITLIVMPLIVYPLLGITFQRFLLEYFLTSTQQGGNQVWLIGVASLEDASLLHHYLCVGDTILKSGDDMDRRRELVATLDRSKPLEYTFSEGHKIQYIPIEEPVVSVSKGEVDIAMVMHRGESDDGPNLHLDSEFLFRSRAAGSLGALRFAERRLAAINAHYHDTMERQPRVDTEMPARFSARGVVDEMGQPISLTALIPLILILMTITGAVYPAIDLTAGERERGTLEPLIAAPIPRVMLLFAKYVAVLSVAILTGVVNLIGMTITITSSGLTEMLIGKSGSVAALAVQVMGLLILFSAFFSAILLALTTFARSFKEAQAYLIPLMLICLAPGIVSLLPDLEYTPGLALVPLLNIVLLARDLLAGKAVAVTAILAIVSTAFYASAAIGLAARVFGTDAVLYGSKSTWSECFRRPERVQSATSLDSALLCLAFVFPLYYVASSTLSRVFADEPASQPFASAICTILLFAGIPWLVISWARVRISSGFRVRGFTWYYAAVGLLLGCSLWPFALEMLLYSVPFDELQTNVDMHERFGKLAKRLEAWAEIPLSVRIAAFAVVPGICEELFFRGFLLAALLRVLSRWQAIVISALLFGLFHVVMGGILAYERFLPSTLLGFFLGWLCVRAGSVIPGIFLHVTHNALMLLGIQSFEALQLGRIADQGHVPLAWLATASLIVIGVCIFTVRFALPAQTPSARGRDAARG